MSMQHLSRKVFHRARKIPQLSRFYASVVETLEARRLLAAFTVTNTNDGGVGSLRFAVDAANFTPAVPDIINFNLPAGDTTINLLANDTNNPFAFGATALVITSPITIAADASKPGVTLDALGVHRLFAVSSSGSLTLQNITLTHGVAQGGAGASEFAGVAGNSAGGGGGAAGLGGAIFVNGGALSVQNSTLFDNVAAGGAGGNGIHTPGNGPLGGGGGGGVGGSGGAFDGSSSGGGGGGGGVAGAGGTSSLPTGGGPGGANENGDQTDPTMNGTFGGGGGGSPSTGGNGTATTVIGIFGGGGGGGDTAGGLGGFSGGGGGSHHTGGAGGFGGGGGGGGDFAGDSEFGGGIGGIGDGGGGGGAGLGGAIFNNGGSITVINSTISGNVAHGGAGGTASGGGNNGGSGGSDGSAIFTRNGQVTVINSTIYLNNQGITVLGDGAAAQFTMENSILSNNASSGPEDFLAQSINGGSPLVNGSNNLIQNNLSFPSAGIVSIANPMLGPLADNGGPTKTHLPLPGSPAIDAGSNDFVTPGSEVQTVTVTGASGTFNLTFEGQPTGALDVTSPTLASDIQNALNGLSTIGGVGGFVTVNSNAAVFTVTFGGTLANLDVPSLTATASSGATVAVATTRNGSSFTQTTDQRGFARVFNGTVDIGAVELQSAAVTVIANGASFSGTEGRTLTKTVATFTSSNTADLVSSYAADIAWGDGKTSTGLIVSDGAGAFHVTGSHRYAEQSSASGYSVKVTIHRTGTSDSSVTSHAHIADAVLDQAHGLSLTKSKGVAFTNLTLGSFRDQDSLNTIASDYSGTIDWGDGSAKSSTKFVFNGSTLDVGSFWKVQGSHKYSAKKTYTVKITIFDLGNPSAKLTITATIKVT